jgi:hypothetical protein
MLSTLRNTVTMSPQILVITCCDFPRTPHLHAQYTGVIINSVLVWMTNDYSYP